MKVGRWLVAASVPLILGVSQKATAQEKHPEHPKKEHPEGKQAGISKADLASSIKAWVEKESAANGGWLTVEDPVQNKTLQLKLDKVHDDKLAQVKPDEYFACADFVEKDGTKYDIDVFMQGKTKADLKETEVTVHKVNGKERYTWFEENGIWKKKAV